MINYILFSRLLRVFTLSCFCIILNCQLCAQKLSDESTAESDSLNLQSENEKDDNPVKSFWENNFITGDWWGLRGNLNNDGFDFELKYKGEIFSNLYGGFNRATKTLDNIDIIINCDLEKITGLPDASLQIQILGNNGSTPNDLAGTSQGISNIETIPTWKLYQFLFEKKFIENKLSILAGLYDLNSEFDTRESSALFINPSHGIGPDFSQSGLNGPSIFPTTSLVARIKYVSDYGNFIQAAILDGVPGDPDNPEGTHITFNKNDGLLLTSEFGQEKFENDILQHKIAVGAWLYTSKSEFYEFAGDVQNLVSYQNNYGFYLSAESLLFDNKNDNLDNLYGFLRLGFANKNVNPVAYYFGGGLKYSYSTGNELTNEIGLAFAFAHNSIIYRTASAQLDGIFIRPSELNLELTYSYQITPCIRVQPDIQYIINPAYCEVSNKAFLFGTRVELCF